MDYDKIIMDMLNRICILEEQVKNLKGESNEMKKKIGTVDIKNYIDTLKQEAKDNGDAYIELISNDVHKALNLQNRMPIVCNAMRQSMSSKDIILHQTASGHSSTLKIRYIIN